MAIAMIPLPPLERCRTLLSYEPTTGLLTWKTRVAGASERELKRWNSRYAGKVACGNARTRSGHQQMHIDGRMYYAHRVIWLMITGAEPIEQVDHVNGDPDDNKWVNLRLASHADNVNNSGLRSNNNSGHKGVHWSRASKKWHAQIGVNRRKLHLGLYEEIDDAVAAYRVAAQVCHGEFARLT